MKEAIEVQIISLSFESYMKYPLSQPCLEASEMFSTSSTFFFFKETPYNQCNQPATQKIQSEKEVICVSKQHPAVIFQNAAWGF